MAGTEAYPFDPTGQALTNKIAGEPQIITAENAGDYHFIVPKFAPYFMSSLKIVYKDTTGVQRILKKGVDWYESHEFVSASRACAAPVFGSISFLNLDLSGVVYLDYQTIGGNWTQNSQVIAGILADRIHNPRIVTWEQVTELPYAFPPIDHEWDLVDMVGAKEIVASLQEIEAALRFKSGSDFSAHMTNMNNPHGVTATQIGLGSVVNLPLATAANALDTQNNAAYLTPMSAAGLIKQEAVDPLAAHIANSGNPHSTTAEQVGTYTSQVIDNKLSDKLDKTSAAADSTKFSGMTSAQFTAEVLKGTSANTKMFDGRTYMQLLADIQGGGGTNATTFGGMTTDEYAEAVLAGTAANTSHFNNVAYVDFMEAIAMSTVANATHLDGLTPAEFSSQVLSGTANNSTKLDNHTVDELTMLILSGTAANAGKFNNQTAAQFTASVLTGTAADATKFNNQTSNDWTMQIQGWVGDSKAQTMALVNQAISNIQATTELNSTTINNLNATVVSLQTQIEQINARIDTLTNPG
jgi:hypothetical protein